MIIAQYDMLDSADRADLQPVTELYGGKRHCRKVLKDKIQKQLRIRDIRKGSAKRHQEGVCLSELILSIVFPARRNGAPRSR